LKIAFKRSRRTIILGVAACGVLIWAAIDQFDIPPEEMARLFGYTVAGVLLVIVIAALGVGLIVGIRYLLAQFRRE